MSLPVTAVPDRSAGARRCAIEIWERGQGSGLEPGSICQPLDSTPVTIEPARMWLGALSLVMGALLLEVTGIDLEFMDALYAVGGGKWVLRDAWWTKVFLHEGGQNVIKLSAVLAGLVWIASWGQRRLAPYRRVSGYLCLMVVLSAVVAGIGKKTTHIACPWDLTRYGGTLPYVKLFEARPQGVRPGRCFPGGHASGGFALFGLYFVARAQGWKCPNAWLGFGFAVGTVFALTQWLRGAHFPSHDVWTAAGCWALSWVLFRYGFKQRLNGSSRAGNPAL